MSLQRSNQDDPSTAADRHSGEVILPGDLLHVDFGLTYLRLNTDTQQHAYVLKPNETAVPDGLRRLSPAAIGCRIF